MDADGTVLDVESVVRRLRIGCPWNLRQTPRDLLMALKAEIAELADAVDNGTSSAIRDELGDVLFNVVSIAEFFRELGWFSLSDVDRTVADKMVSRHPYVFGDQPVPGPDEARLLWEASKRAEDLERAAAQLGVSFACEVAWPALSTSKSIDRMKHALTGLAASIGARDSTPCWRHLGGDGDPLGEGGAVCLMTPSVSLLARTFSGRASALLQGYIRAEIDPARLRDAIALAFGSDVTLRRLQHEVDRLSGSVIG